MLEEGNLIDFSTIQTECYKLLMQNKQILEELQDKLQYLMIDEYQDTNYIQEQIVFLLGAKHHNICVVGDDDQGLYRFRGATIRNILEFPHKFENEGCKIIPLVVNYRSNSDIVDFYNEWISTTSGHKFKFSWDRYRYQKKIEPHVKSDIQSPAVVKLFSKDDEDEWHEKILGFIKELKESGKLTDYNQLAFLFSSVKHQRVTALANFLERNGINVYSPRSDMFFKRDEIKLALGCLMLMFPKYVMKLEKQEFDFLQVEHYRYYRECIVAANEYVTKSTQKSEDVDMVLLREPKDSGYYEFSANDELVITKGHNNFTPKEEAKSFHADTYCFDSKPEKECFLQYISSNKVKEIYFTGMFTSNQGDLSVQYYDPESKRLRKYYPDFLALMEDGSYQLIEVKGDNKIDDEVVLAKKAAAEEMAVASGIHYLMYAGSTLMKSNVLEPTLVVQQASIDI